MHVYLGVIKGGHGGWAVVAIESVKGVHQTITIESAKSVLSRGMSGEQDKGCRPTYVSCRKTICFQV